MDRIPVRLRKGVTIRDPHTKRPLPEHGAFVLKNEFYLRRIQDGDLILLKTGEEIDALKRDIENSRKTATNAPAPAPVVPAAPASAPAKAMKKGTVEDDGIGTGEISELENGGGE